MGSPACDFGPAFNILIQRLYAFIHEPMLIDALFDAKVYQ